MKLCLLTEMRAPVAIAIALVAIPAVAIAQTDEIQVYDGAIAEPGLSI